MGAYRLLYSLCWPDGWTWDSHPRTQWFANNVSKEIIILGPSLDLCHPRAFCLTIRFLFSLNIPTISSNQSILEVLTKQTQELSQD
jgi:hypothetical protein